MSEKIIIALVFIVIYTILDAFHDFSFISWKDKAVLFAKTGDSAALTDYKKFGNIWHRTDAVIKFLVIGLLCYLIWGVSIKAIQYTLLLGLVRWLIFDITINRLRGLPADYIGTTADTDLLLKQIGINQIILKIMLLLIAVAWIVIF